MHMLQLIVNLARAQANAHFHVPYLAHIVQRLLQRMDDALKIAA
jgi:hypothetical protein